MASNTLRFLNLDSSVDCTCDILNKDYGSFTYVTYMLDRTNQMFEYDGLPDTIPQYMLELMLQAYGSVGIVRAGDGNLYALRGHVGGPPDPYYRPTLFVTANPALGTEVDVNYRIVNHFPSFDKSVWESYDPCVFCRNDTEANGLLPLFARYAAQMVENDISIRSAQINSRQQTMIVANNGQEIESANVYIQNLIDGKLSAVATRPFLEGVSATNVSTMSSNSIIQLIELQQYLKASWYNELGLNSNFNMKREYLSAEEIKASTDVLLPLVDDMLYSRQLWIEALNKEFGTTITVRKNSAWEKKQQESDARMGDEEVDTVETVPGGDDKASESVVDESETIEIGVVELERAVDDVIDAIDELADEINDEDESEAEDENSD